MRTIDCRRFLATYRDPYPRGCGFRSSNARSFAQHGLAFAFEHAPLTERSAARSDGGQRRIERNPPPGGYNAGRAHQGGRRPRRRGPVATRSKPSWVWSAAGRSSSMLPRVRPRPVARPVRSLLRTPAFYAGRPRASTIVRTRADQAVADGRHDVRPGSASHTRVGTACICIRRTNPRPGDARSIPSWVQRASVSDAVVPALCGALWPRHSGPDEGVRGTARIERSGCVELEHVHVHEYGAQHKRSLGLL